MWIKRRTYNHLSDIDLIASYRMNPSNKLFEEIYVRYSHLVLGTCLKYLKNEQDAEDCAMHIFEELPSRIHRQPIDFFSSWLYRVVVNECLQSIRKTKKYIDIDQLIHLRTMEIDEADFETDQSIELIIGLIESLKDEQKRCVSDFYLNKKSYQQIAEETGWSIKLVKSAIQNGKRNLRLKYEEHESKYKK